MREGVWESERVRVRVRVQVQVSVSMAPSSSSSSSCDAVQTTTPHSCMLPRPLHATPTRKKKKILQSFRAWCEQNSISLCGRWSQPHSVLFDPPCPSQRLIPANINSLLTNQHTAAHTKKNLASRSVHTDVPVKKPQTTMFSPEPFGRPRWHWPKPFVAPYECACACVSDSSRAPEMLKTRMHVRMISSTSRAASLVGWRVWTGKTERKWKDRKKVSFEMKYRQNWVDMCMHMGPCYVCEWWCEYDNVHCKDRQKWRERRISIQADWCERLWSTLNSEHLGVRRPTSNWSDGANQNIGWELFRSSCGSVSLTVSMSKVFIMFVNEWYQYFAVRCEF